MKNKKLFIIGLSLLIILLASACSTNTEQQSQTQTQTQTQTETETQTQVQSAADGVEKIKNIRYSNLVDKKTQGIVESALLDAGIAKEKVEHFLEDVNKYNQTIENTSLVEKDFTTSKDLAVKYDVVTIADKLDQHYPEVIWHNCRLSTFRLLSDFIEIKNPEIEDTLSLFQDKESIEYDPSLVGDKSDNFFSIFAYIPTENTKDVDTHLKVLQENWHKKGIKFTNEKISLVSVVFNSYIPDLDEHPQLFIGHAGLLWTNEEGKLYFLEKLSFTDPYQLLIFNNRQELSDYLMNKYDVDLNQDTAIPLVMENDQLIEGYRPNPDKGEETK